MARTVAATTVRQRRRGRIPLLATLTLAWWRLRQTWRLLLTSGLGIVAAVMLVCAVPLFSEVAMSAGLRSALTAFPQASQVIVNGNIGPGSSPDVITQAQPTVDRVVTSSFGPYLTSSTPTVSTFLPAEFQVDVPSSSGAVDQRLLSLSGMDFAAAGSRIHLLSGRLPAASATTLEVVIDKASADSTGIQPGQSFDLQLGFGGKPGAPGGPAPSTPTRVQVVGIVAPLANGNTPVKGFNANGTASQCGSFGPQVFIGPGGEASITAFTTNEQMFAAGSSFVNGGPPLFVSWAYSLDLSRVTASSFGDLRQRADDFQNRGFELLRQTPGVDNPFPSSPLQCALNVYLSRVIVVQIPIVLLLIQVMGLVLLFVSLMVNLLIERQVEAIAVLRSRGASRGVILRSLTVQSIGVGLLALVAGPLLAVVLVRQIAERVLPPASRDAIGIVAGNPVPVALDLKWYAISAAVVAVFAMIVSTRRAAGFNVLALRRESARVMRKPFWVRLNLDLIFGAISILGYAAYSYAVANVDARVKPILSPLSLFAMLFLLLAITLLFLRFFPLLLALVARLTARGRSAPAMLAVGQLARAPRQSARMTLLLALSTAFALFSLVFTASVSQRVQDVAAYQVGGDFSGTLDATLAQKTSFEALSARYASISGVTSATLGDSFTVDPSGVSANINMQVLAVDAGTYASTVLWSPTFGAASPSDLMAALAAHRVTASSAPDTPVPAILDATTMKALHLAPGDTFSLQIARNDSGRQRFIAVAQVAHIPTLYSADQGFGPDGGSGGMLVDYASFAAAYHPASGDPILPNTVWLRTRDDSTSLASVRAALLDGDLALSSPQDRRALIDDTHADPLNIDLVSVLGIAAATALLLAILGIVIASWLSARVRLTSFALLRALGTEPGQLAGVLFWEQGIVYTLALALGIGLGAVLTVAVLPILVFVDNVGRNGFVPTDIPPVRTVLPPETLLPAIAALAIVCVLSILLMVSVVSRASLSQTLRLNED